MACYHPSDVSVSRKTPYGRVPDLVTVPCGWCLGCRADQARDWAIRLMHEAQVLDEQELLQERRPNPRSWFLTLTYSPEALPENGSLRPSDVSSFARALRKRSGGRISYYACGEYGEHTARPHYHAVLCGPRFLDRDLLEYRVSGPVWRSSTLEGAWTHGISELTALTWEGASYVAGYVRKKLQADPSSPDSPYDRVDPKTGEVVRLEREFARMSRRPGIGRRWIEKYWQDVYPRDYVIMGGREYKPPRYYDRWLEAHRPDVMMAVREQRYADAVEIGDEKLIMKEKIHRARVALYQTRSKV